MSKLKGGELYYWEIFCIRKDRGGKVRGGKREEMVGEREKGG